MNARLTPWLFLMPAILIYGVFGAYPIFQTFAISFTDQVGVAEPGKFVGLQNYIPLVQDQYFLNAMKNTGIWVLAFLIVPNTLAITIALLVKQTFWGAGLIKTVFFLPLALSFAIVGVIWGWIYEPDVGLLDQLLKMFDLEGLIVEWLGPDGADAPGGLRPAGCPGCHGHRRPLLHPTRHAGRTGLHPVAVPLQPGDLCQPAGDRRFP